MEEERDESIESDEIQDVEGEKKENDDKKSKSVSFNFD
jgi:hypothetical protein